MHTTLIQSHYEFQNPNKPSSFGPGPYSVASITTKAKKMRNSPFQQVPEQGVCPSKDPKERAHKYVSRLRLCEVTLGADLGTLVQSAWTEGGREGGLAARCPLPGLDSKQRPLFPSSASQGKGSSLVVQTFKHSTWCRGKQLYWTQLHIICLSHH